MRGPWRHLEKSSRVCSRQTQCSGSCRHHCLSPRTPAQSLFVLLSIWVNPRSLPTNGFLESTSQRPSPMTQMKSCGEWCGAFDSVVLVGKSCQIPDEEYHVHQEQPIAPPVECAVLAKKGSKISKLSLILWPHCHDRQFTSFTGTQER